MKIQGNSISVLDKKRFAFSSRENYFTVYIDVSMFIPK